MENLSNYLVISSILFSLGIFGVVTRRNGVAVLMGVELILNAANLNFLAFARFGGMNMSGHVYALFVIVLAALRTSGWCLRRSRLIDVSRRVDECYVFALADWVLHQAARQL